MARTYAEESAKGEADTHLTLPAVTVVWYVILSGMALTLGFPAGTRQENRLLSAVKNRDSQLIKVKPSCPSCGSHPKNETFGDLEPIIIKMENIIGKFEDNRKQFKKLYPSFSRLLLSNKKEPRSLGCLIFKDPNRQVSQLAKDIRKINKDLRSLIYYEKSQYLKNHDGQEGRLVLLKGFQAETKNLLEELRSYRKGRNEGRKTSRQTPKERASENLSHIEFLTALKIEEWKLLKTLKRNLKHKIRDFKLFFHCL